MTKHLPLGWYTPMLTSRQPPATGYRRVRRGWSGGPVRPAIRPRAALAITFVVAGLAPAGCAARSNIDVPATAQAAACAPLRVTSVTPDFGFGNLFQNYGDQNLLGLHWTDGRRGRYYLVPYLRG